MHISLLYNVFFSISCLFTYTCLGVCVHVWALGMHACTCTAACICGQLFICMHVLLEESNDIFLAAIKIGCALK